MDTKFVTFNSDTHVITEDGATRRFKAGATKALPVADADRMIAGGMAVPARKAAGKPPARKRSRKAA